MSMFKPLGLYYMVERCIEVSFSVDRSKNRLRVCHTCPLEPKVLMLLGTQNKGEAQHITGAASCEATNTCEILELAIPGYLQPGKIDSMLGASCDTKIS